MNAMDVEVSSLKESRGIKEKPPEEQEQEASKIKLNINNQQLHSNIVKGI